jgi:ABC-type multidrug transport system fused ATPase/permease subunit
LIWALGRNELAKSFDQVLVMRNGQVVAQGAYDTLIKDGNGLDDMIAA